MNTRIDLDPTLISLLVGSIIPLITAFATKYSASSGIKAAIALVLSAVAAVLIEVAQAGGFVVKVALVEFAVVFTSNLVAYAAFWQPVTKINAILAPRFGIGPTAPNE